MKIITDKFILLENNIVSIFIDPEEFLLHAEENHNIELKSNLGLFLSQPEIHKFFGFYFLLDPDGIDLKSDWFMLGSAQFEEIIETICEDGVLDLRQVKMEIDSEFEWDGDENG